MAHGIKVKRKELKFYISYKEYVVLSNLLKKVLIPDKHNKNDNGYFIRSLYFDTLDNKEFEDKMAGIEHRSKYRIRIYDLKSHTAKFEAKRKFNEIAFKETVAISREDAIEIQKRNYEVMLKYNNKFLNKAYKEFKKSQYYPVVVIDYLREAYTYDLNNIRIVFDRFLKSSTLQLDLFSKDVFTTQRLNKNLVLMEIKYNGFIPDWLKKIIQIPSAERSAISKYCIGRLDKFEEVH